MRCVVLGGKGMLGTDLVGVLRAQSHEVEALSRSECDVRDAEAVQAAVLGADVVVNAAAWTDVDGAEQHEAAAFAINALGARNAAVAAQSQGARLIHISTDYVFEGSGRRPYATGHPQSSASAYGRTKAAGEWAGRDAHPDAQIVRTAWLYGEHGPNFVKTMFELAARKDALRVVADQVGQPTWTCDLAEYLAVLIRSESIGGYYHGTSTGEVSRYEFARAIF
jgi:dTDP-4-dehydrorhamnose reductase